MREILFKAKRIDNGEWVEGYLFETNDNSYIAYNGQFDDDLLLSPQNIFIPVDKTTICQYTGLTDENGNKIWENDVLRFEDIGEEGYEYKEGFDFINRARVEFAEGRWSLIDFVSENSGVMEEMYNHAEFMEFWQYCEVVGNLFDNPEFLKGGGEDE